MTEEMEDLQDVYPGAGTFRFGDSAEMCNRLNALVRAGAKTASCDALANYQTEPEAMPKLGRCDIATDWDDVPALVTRTVRLEQIRFCDVGEAAALAGGENADLAGWRKGHKAFLNATAALIPRCCCCLNILNLLRIWQTAERCHWRYDHEIHPCLVERSSGNDGAFG